MIMQTVLNRMSKTLAALALLLTAMTVQGQADSAQAWVGDWVAEGTLFQIRVVVEDNVLTATPIESMGFEWSSEDAELLGNVVEVAVDYQTGGVSGIIRAELLNETTGVLSVITCTPEYMVSCALSKGRQAVFRKVAVP
ncbi:MAG: hypothetical protein ACI95C_003042 [Pseudohongiellaceae bacterium]|jgi:hypothetical protein